MIVYSVLVERQSDGSSWVQGPWLHEWMAEKHAAENNLECRRVVIKWQMLNAEFQRTFGPGDKS